MRRPETWIVFQPITKMKNTTCVFHPYNSQLHFIDFNWPKNSPMHHAFPQGLKRAHQKYSWSSVISGEIKRSHVLLQMYPFHSNIGERDQSMLSVSLLLKEMEQKLSYMLFSFSGKEWLLSRLRRLQTFKILQTCLASVLKSYQGTYYTYFPQAYDWQYYSKWKEKLLKNDSSGSVKKIESLIRSFVFRRWPKSPQLWSIFKKKA